MGRTFTQERKPKVKAMRGLTKAQAKRDAEAARISRLMSSGLNMEEAMRAVSIADDIAQAKREASAALRKPVDGELAKALADAWEALEMPRMEAAQALAVPFMLASAWANASREYRKGGAMVMKPESLAGLRSILAI